MFYKRFKFEWKRVSSRSANNPIFHYVYVSILKRCKVFVLMDNTGLEQRIQAQPSALESDRFQIESCRRANKHVFTHFFRNSKALASELSTRPQVPSSHFTTRRFFERNASLFFPISKRRLSKSSEKFGINCGALQWPKFHRL